MNGDTDESRRIARYHYAYAERRQWMYLEGSRLRIGGRGRKDVLWEGSETGNSDHMGNVLLPDENEGREFCV